MLDRIGELDGRLQSYATVMADQALAAASRAEAELGGARSRRPAPRRADRGQGPLLHPKGVSDDGRHAASSPRTPEIDATVVERFRTAGAVLLGKLQLTEGAIADYHPEVKPPGQPVARRPLGRRLVERLGRRDRGRALLRFARLRYRRVDPISVGRQRRHRPQADLGPGQPLRGASRSPNRSTTSDRWRAAPPMRRSSSARSPGRTRTIRRRCRTRCRTIWPAMPGSTACASDSTSGTPPTASTRGVGWRGRVHARCARARGRHASVTRRGEPFSRRLADALLGRGRGGASPVTYPARRDDYGPWFRGLDRPGAPGRGRPPGAAALRRGCSGLLRAAFAPVDAPRLLYRPSGRTADGRAGSELSGGVST